jgi:hypothetical protein
MCYNDLSISFASDFVFLGLLSFFTTSKAVTADTKNSIISTSEVSSPTKDTLLKKPETLPETTTMASEGYTWTQIIGITVGITLCVVLVVGLVYYFNSGPNKGGDSHSSSGTPVVSSNPSTSASSLGSSTSSVSDAGDIGDMADVTTTVEHVVNIAAVVVENPGPPARLLELMLPILTRIENFITGPYSIANAEDIASNQVILNIKYIRTVLVDSAIDELTQEKFGVCALKLLSYVLTKGIHVYSNISTNHIEEIMAICTNLPA